MVIEEESLLVARLALGRIVELQPELLRVVNENGLRELRYIYVEIPVNIIGQDIIRLR